MYTQTKTEIQQRIAITEWLEANLSQFKNQKNYFSELCNALNKALGYKVTAKYTKKLLQEVAEQQGYNVSFETETIKAERRNITVFVLTQTQTPPETPQKNIIETPLTLAIRSYSYNPDVRNGKAPITIFDVLQWLRANVNYDIEPNATADGTIYACVSLRFNNGFKHKKIAKWDIRYPYLNQQPISLLKDITSYLNLPINFIQNL